MANSSSKTFREIKVKNKICIICNKKINANDKTIRNENGKIVHYNCLMDLIGEGVEKTGIGFGNR
ncbi:MAG: hypothetical protein ACTSO9_13765 [Candidatus Helarchaeota archaeon]